MRKVRIIRVEGGWNATVRRLTPDESGFNTMLTLVMTYKSACQCVPKLFAWVNA